MAAGTGSGPVGIAVIGAGYWGPNLVRNFQATAGARLEALCDLNTDRARKVLGEYSTVRVTDSYESLLADPAVHAVAIATPASSHYELALAALEAGKHVLVEKPLTDSLAEAEKLVELAEARGLVLMCDHTYCYTPAVQKIREMIHSGELGEIQFLDSVRINLGLVQPDVDVIWDLAPHDVSILDYVLPEGVHPVAVAAHGSDPIGAGRACVAYLTIRLSNGASAHVHVNWLSPVKIRTTVIGGSQRNVVWDDLSVTQRVSVYDRGVDKIASDEMGEAARHKALVSYRAGDMVAPALSEGEALRAMAGEFVGAITEGRTAATDGRSGLRVMRLLSAASTSLAQGGLFVDLDLDA